MSLEEIQTEIAALRSDVKSLTKIVRKIKAKQDDPDGTKAASRAKNNGFNREQAISPKLADFLGVEADNNLEASSHSFARRSSAFDITFLTISNENSGHWSSRSDRTHSSTSSDANNSSIHSDNLRLNSASVYWGPINEQPCS